MVFSLAISIFTSVIFSKCFLVNAWKGLSPSSSVIMRGLSSDSDFVVRRLLTTKQTFGRERVETRSTGPH